MNNVNVYILTIILLREVIPDQYWTEIAMSDFVHWTLPTNSPQVPYTQFFRKTAII